MTTERVALGVAMAVSAIDDEIEILAEIERPASRLQGLQNCRSTFWQNNRVEWDRLV